MTNLENCNFPDFSALQTKLLEVLSPLKDDADLKIQFPSAEFDISSKRPTITASIKSIAIYNPYQKMGEKAPLPVKLSVALGIYIPKAMQSDTAYLLFSKTAKLLCDSELNIEKLSADELCYLPDLRHYCLKSEAELKPVDIKEEQDGNDDV